jgi:hypothetical protein
VLCSLRVQLKTERGRERGRRREGERERGETGKRCGRERI